MLVVQRFNDVEKLNESILPIFRAICHPIKCHHVDEPIFIPFVSRRYSPLFQQSKRYADGSQVKQPNKQTTSRWIPPFAKQHTYNSSSNKNMSASIITRAFPGQLRRLPQWMARASLNGAHQRTLVAATNVLLEQRTMKLPGLGDSITEVSCC